MDCEPFSERRYQCHAVYGKGGEECLHQELSEKRCLSLRHCPKQAKEYYGDFPMRPLLDAAVDEHGSPLFLTKKALCASWAEAFAYAGSGTTSSSTTTDNDQHEQRLIYGDAVVEHHRQAQTTVSKDPALKQDCRQVAFALAQCLRTKRLF